MEDKKKEIEIVPGLVMVSQIPGGKSDKKESKESTKGKESKEGKEDEGITLPLVIIERTYIVKLQAAGYGPEGVPGARGQAISRARKELNMMEVAQFSSKGVTIGDWFVEESDIIERATNEMMDNEDEDEG